MRRAISGLVVAIALALVTATADAQTLPQAPATDTDFAQFARSCRGPLPDDAGYPPTASTPVTVRILQPITLVPATDGFIHLAYVAQVTNLSTGAARVDSITPVDPLGGFKPTGMNAVVDMAGADITGKVRLFNPNLHDGPQTRKIVDFAQMPGGTSGTTFFDVRYKSAGDVPRLLSHRIVIRLEKPALSMTAPTDPVAVSCQSPAVLVPPLKGSGWWNGNGCCERISPHRGATLPMNGDIKAPEAFAIDYVQLNANEGCCTGPVRDLASWPFFRAPILAAANGTVVEAVNDMPEQIPGPPVGVTIENAAGNHIIEAIGDSRYILYAHLHTNSIPARIKIGSRLTAGEQIGELGNTGSSTAPHLHFQVMDRPSALNARGLPFVFVSQKLEGTVIGTAKATDEAYESGKPMTVDRSKSGWQAFRMPAETQVFGYNLR